MRKASGGGKAVHSGTDYQNRFAAWIAVRILAEHDAALPLDLPADVTLDRLRFETDQPVDDTLVQTSAHGILFCQAKHSINLGTTQNSPFASVIDQFVRQYVAVRDYGPSALPSGRLLDRRRDRFVLVTSSASSAPVSRDLLAYLRRLRELSPQSKGATLESAASNALERHAYLVVRDHLVRSWRRATGREATDNEVASVLELAHVLVLDLDHGATHELGARDVLRLSILKNPTEADAALNTLVATCALRAKGSSGIDRHGLERLLLDTHHDLKAVQSYRADIERLTRHSREISDKFSHRATIDVGMTRIKIDRPCTAALLAASPDGSLLVVGEPGAGKSISLYESVLAFEQIGHDVVYLSADSLAAESLGDLRTELNLQHELVDVLANWPGTVCGFIVIDALDAARSDGSAKTLRDLIEAVIRSGGRWNVVASIREYDLRYSAELQRLFKGLAIDSFAHPQFKSIRHLVVPRLEPDEIDQVRAQAPELSPLIDGAEERLRELLKVAFNLRLMGELLGGGVPATDLTPIRTQLELLDSCWSHRVIRSDHLGDSREAVLRLVCEVMVAGRALRASRNAVSRDPSASIPLNDVLSSGVIVEWQRSGRPSPDRGFLAYSHHVLHDYAIARLLLRGEAAELIRRLRETPDLAMSIRPSLVMHFQYLWSMDADHGDFWHLTKLVQLAANVPEIARTIGPTVAAELLENPSDFSVILDELRAPLGN